jgi:hypothetical protein
MCGSETRPHRVEDFCVGISGIFAAEERNFITNYCDVGGASKSAEVSGPHLDLDPVGEPQGAPGPTMDQLP